MNSLLHTLKNASPFGLSTYLLLVANSGYTDALNLADTPLFLGSSTEANTLFIIDDSGSMNWAQTMSAAAKLVHPNDINDRIIDIHSNQNNGEERLNHNPQGAEQARRLCAAFNVLAYNESSKDTYTPWAGVDRDGNPYPDMAPTGTGTNSTLNARIDPYLGSASNNITNLDENAYITWNDVNANGEYDNNECPEVFTNKPTFKENCEDNNHCVLISELSVEDKTSYGNWYTYYRKRDYVAKNATLGAIDRLTHPVGLATLHNNSNVATTIADLDDESDNTNADVVHKLNIMSKIAQIRPSGGTPLRTTLEDAGEYFLNGDGSLFNGNVTSPIASAANGGACQINSAILMSDGFASSTATPNVGNLDGDNVSNTLGDVAQKYSDLDFRTGAGYEGVQSMVTHTISFGVTGNLTCNPGEVLSTDPDTNVDTLCTESWPTSISYNGSDPSTIDDMRHAAYNSGGDYSDAGTPEELESIINRSANTTAGGNGFASVASNSSSLSSETVTYQGSFNPEKWSGDLAAVPISTGSDDARPECNGVEFLDFCDELWSAADLLDAAVAATGNAGQVPVGYTNRVVITSKTVTNVTGVNTSTSTKGIPFLWPSDYTTLGDDDLSDTQVALLTNGLADTQKQNEGQILVDYLRGSRSNESPTGLREREHVLGDIVNSAPRFVGIPNMNYADNIETSPYSTYIADNEDRTPMLYVGANDGMLHGFDFETGEEKLAYVPETIFNRLQDLSNQTYSHKYSVDGTPTVVDAYINNQWSTVLLGGLNAGGQGIYALDVSEPDDFRESNADDIVLWEFNDADLGYTFGQPDIIRLHNGRWAALFGNGYNNTEADGLASTTGKGYLYLVDLEDGELIEKIEVDSGSLVTPNGLATTTPIDIDGDSIIDYVYAGDLNGNLWRFNLIGANTGSWDVELIFTAVAPENNAPQPITSRPSVSFHPENGRDGVLIFFGTGRYIDESDNDVGNQITQSFYAVWDDLDDSIGNDIPATFNRSRTDYVQQTIINQTAVTRDDLSTTVSRLTSSNTIDWDVNSGWYIDLTYAPAGSNLGERQISSSLLSGDSVIFVSTQPNLEDADAESCNIAGVSYLTKLDLASGAAQSESLDIDGDGDTDDQGNGFQINGIVGSPIIIKIPPTLGGSETETENGNEGGGENEGEGEGEGTVVEDDDCSEALITPDLVTESDTECPAGADRQSWNEVLRD